MSTCVAFRLSVSEAQIQTRALMKEHPKMFESEKSIRTRRV